MKRTLFAVFAALLLSPLSGLAQLDDDERFAITAGVEFRSLQNFPIFNLDSVVLVDPNNNFRGVYELQDGIGFGGVIRMRLSKIWNIESGLYYTRRRYRFDIQDLQQPFEDQNQFRVISYEIPIKGLVYIQLGDQLYMNVAMGVAFNFFASDIIRLERTYNFQGYKPAWMRFGVLGNVGFEWRTEKNGYFYLGATWHQIQGAIMRTEINYYRASEESAGQFEHVGRQRDFLDGTYFSIDLRYFIQPKVDRRPKVNRVIPTWKTR